MPDERVKGLVESVDDVAFIKAVISRTVEEKVAALKKDLTEELKKIIQDEVQRKQLTRVIERPPSLLRHDEPPILPERDYTWQPWHKFEYWTTATSFKNARNRWLLTCQSGSEEQR